MLINKVPSGLRRAIPALDRPVEPMTPADTAEYNLLIAREMARATARRLGYSPQSELPLPGQESETR